MGFLLFHFIYLFFFSFLSCSWAMICCFGASPIIVLLALFFSFLQNLLGALQLLFAMKPGKELESYSSHSQGSCKTIEKNIQSRVPANFTSNLWAISKNAKKISSHHEIDIMLWACVLVSLVKLLGNWLDKNMFWM